MVEELEVDVEELVELEVEELVTVLEVVDELEVELEVEEVEEVEHVVDNAANKGVFMMNFDVPASQIRISPFTRPARLTSTRPEILSKMELSR